VLAKKFQEAWNNNDASALAALFTEDAVLVNDSGPVPQTKWTPERRHPLIGPSVRACFESSAVTEIPGGDHDLVELSEDLHRFGSDPGNFHEWAQETLMKFRCLPVNRRAWLLTRFDD